MSYSRPHFIIDEGLVDPDMSKAYTLLENCRQYGDVSIRVNSHDHKFVHMWQHCALCHKPIESLCVRLCWSVDTKWCRCPEPQTAMISPNFVTDRNKMDWRVTTLITNAKPHELFIRNVVNPDEEDILDIVIRRAKSIGAAGTLYYSITKPTNVPTISIYECLNEPTVHYWLFTFNNIFEQADILPPSLENFNRGDLLMSHLYNVLQHELGYHVLYISMEGLTVVNNLIETVGFSVYISGMDLTMPALVKLYDLNTYQRVIKPSDKASIEIVWNSDYPMNELSLSLKYSGSGRSYCCARHEQLDVPISYFGPHPSFLNKHRVDDYEYVSSSVKRCLPPANVYDALVKLDSFKIFIDDIYSATLQHGDVCVTHIGFWK